MREIARLRHLVRTATTRLGLKRKLKMKISDFYRGLLRLYPADFQEQFSEEMLGVFEQRAAEHFASGGTASIALVAKEFVDIAKGGCLMRMANIIPVGPPTLATTLSQVRSLRRKHH